MAWLKETNELTVPKSHLASAINYCLNQWDALNTFLLDGRLPIDNNAAERAIRPFVVGRKNFLFCNTPNARAIIYSLVETAKENGLKPFDYPKYLLQEMPNAHLMILTGLCRGQKPYRSAIALQRKIESKLISNLHLTDGGFFYIFGE